MVYIGNWILNSTRGDDRFEDYDNIESKLFALCREQGITVVLITHHMEECVGADRVIVLSNGAVVADGAPKQVFPQVGLLQKEGLTAPVTVRLLDALRAHGMDVPIDALTVSDCADAVAAALKK